MTDRKCPLGEDCDLTVAWMAGAEDVRQTYRARLEEMTVQRDLARYEADQLRHRAEAAEARAEAAETIARVALEEATEVADRYHAAELEWAKNVRGLNKEIDQTDSSRIAAEAAPSMTPPRWQKS